MNARSIITIALASIATFTFVPGLVSGSASAAPLAASRGSHGSDSAGPVQQEEPEGGAKVYAKGTHKCQSRESIGHTCQITAFDMPTCDIAKQVMAKRDCCPQSEYGGNSIEFSLDECY